VTLDEIKTLYDSLCTPMDSYLGAVEQVQARHVLASKAFPFLVQIATAARHHLEHTAAFSTSRAQIEAKHELEQALAALEEAKL
jgi:hypothetical protein